MHPLLCGALGTTGPQFGALVSRRWEAHKHFLYQEPGGVQAKRVARGESYRVFQGSLVFLLPTGSPSSVLRS